jgi:hypothetical protein
VLETGGPGGGDTRNLQLDGNRIAEVAWLNHATVAPPVVGVLVLCVQMTRAVTRVSTM